MNIARSLPRGVVVPLLGTIAAILPARGVEIQKASNATALNLGGSWTGGAVPGATDVALFDSTISAPFSVALGGDLSWEGIRVTAVGGTRNAANTAVTITNAGSANTLSLGSGGIDMSTALQTLVIQSRVTLTANQIWNVANANTATNPASLSQNEDLTFISQAAGTPFNLGGFSVTKTGAGTTAFSSGHTISNGTFNVDAGVLHFQGGASRITTILDTVSFNVNGGTLRFAAQSGAGGITTQVNAPITLNEGSTFALHLNQANTINLTGNITVAGNTTWTVFGGATGNQTNFSGSLLGAGNITYANTNTNAAGLLRMSGNNGGYSGIFTVNGASGTRILRLTGADSGSASATWSVAAANFLEVDGVGVQLGSLNGAGTVANSHTSNPASISVGSGNFSGSITDGAVFGGMTLTKVGTGTLTLSGLNTYTGNTLVNQGTLVATPGSLGQTNVIVADGAVFTPRVTAPGGTLFLPGLTIGASSGATLNFDLGNFGNPIAAALSATTFTPQVPATLKLTGNGLTPGTFPLLDYGVLDGVGFPGLNLVLPPRVIGSLVHDVANTAINVSITGLDTPKWTGATNGNWDIDDGTGTGTANWREINNGGVTRYLQTAGGSDTVTFNDSATGTTTVNLTTTLLPNGVTVDNSTLLYQFTGTGRISGSTTLTKLGTGTLRLLNSGTNDYSGVTTINAGTVELGDGVTPGAGTLGTGAVTNNGTLVLNRPDAFTIVPVVSGTGGITKNSAETTTFTGNVTQSGPIALNGGTLTFSGGGTLTGAISGPGALTSTAGTFEIGGFDANTHTGMTTVSNGNLRLNKPAGVNAVGGNVTITGGATLSLAAAEQIPDTATIIFTGTSADSIPGPAGTETVASVHANASVPTGQVIMRNNFTATGTSILQNGILGVASGNTANLNALTMSGGILRIAGNSAASTLNIGPGGITASGGTIEVKFNTNDQDAVLNLSGDFTATADIPITNAGYTGPNLNQVVLIGQRTFNLAAGTTTTVQPEVTGAGGITKTGGGTLDLLGRTISYVGDTIVTGGTLRTSTATQIGTASITIGNGGTLELRVPTSGTSLVTSTTTFGSVSGGTLKVSIGDTGNPTAAPLTTTSLAAQGTNILALVGATTAGTFPLIDYTGSIGGSGFGAFQLQLPLRVAGSLVNNLANSSIDVTIQGTDTPTWNGNVNGTWDIDDGTGTGTANWYGAFTGTPTRYLQGSLGTDMVVFNDTATGSTNVNLSTTLTPTGITVDNSTKDYTFSGSGKISGAGGLTKLGSGKLTIVNTALNDFTGPIEINGGIIEIGNNQPGGAGSLGSGPISNQSGLVFNRADDYSLSNAISGGGLVVQSGSGKTTLSGALTYTGDTIVNAGTLALNSPSILSGNIAVSSGASLSLDHPTGTVAGPIANNGTVILNSGASLNAAINGSGGLLVNTPGTKTLGGALANSFTGNSLVTAGNLVLAKNNGGVGVPAIGGDLLIDGGVVTVGVAGSHLGNQFADTSSITVNSGQLLSTFAEGSNKDDTIANLTIHAATPVSTFNGFNITGTLTITAGAQHDAVNSSGTTTANTAILSNTNIRLGANGGPSTLNIGTGGVSLTNASIVYGSAGNNAQLATVNLAGNVTASGTSAFDVNTGNPISRIDLGDSTRTFNIIDGITTVESAIVSSGPTTGLVKTGSGTLVLAAGTNTNGESVYSGDTLVSAGTLVVNGSLSGTSVNVNGGTLGGTGVINPGLLGVSVQLGGKLSPGVDTGLAGTLTVNGSVNLSPGTSTVGSGALRFDLDTPFSSDRVAVNGGVLTIGNGTLDFDDFVFSASLGFTDQTTYVLFEGTSPIDGSLAADRFGTINGFAAELRLSDDQTDLVLFVPEPGSALLLLGGLAMVTTRRRRTT